ncbi:MAG: Dabb family protein [Alkalispirochaetaceae bacterium]
MVKHIVMWKLAESHEGMDKEALAREVQRRILAMKSTVPMLRQIECGIDFNRSDRAWDIALYSSFDDREGLEAYQEHPEHEKVKAFVREVAVEAAVVDYEA